jgi:uncharacterized protein (DUF2384 family)
MTPNLKRIHEKAADVLGSKEKADDWIDHASATLGGTPRRLSESEEGTNRVLIHLADISRHSFT